jgi:hypothetical protein
VKRCHKCEAVISEGREVYVKNFTYHSKCAPDHTAEINVRNLQLLNDRVAKLEQMLDDLAKELKS